MNALALEIHQWARQQGFWKHENVPCPRNPEIHGVSPNPSIYEEKLMLIVSEVAEILEARRDSDEANEEEECADVIIRVLDYVEARGFDIEKAVQDKMEKNRKRPYLHGRSR